MNNVLTPIWFNQLRISFDVNSGPLSDLMWREQFVKKMPELFSNTERCEQSLVRENSRLKKIIGELTVELKKINGWSE